MCYNVCRITAHWYCEYLDHRSLWSIALFFGYIQLMKADFWNKADSEMYLGTKTSHISCCATVTFTLLSFTCTSRQRLIQQHLALVCARKSFLTFKGLFSSFACIGLIVLIWGLKRKFRVLVNFGSLIIILLECISSLSILYFSTPGKCWQPAIHVSSIWRNVFSTLNYISPIIIDMPLCGLLSQSKLTGTIWEKKNRSGYGVHN